MFKARLPSGRFALNRIRDGVLGTDPAQQLRIRRSLLAALLYFAAILLQQQANYVGLSDPAHAALSTAWVVLGPLVFYVALRSGWSLRFTDPALTLPQMMFAMTAIMAGYAVNPLQRSAVLAILAPVMAFGMFSVVPAEARYLTVFMLVGFGGVMSTLARWRPEVFDPRVEVINFLMLVAVMPAIGSLSSRYTRLRSRLREDKAALKAALVKLEHLSAHDELTGLRNRRHMTELLGAETRRRALGFSPACICMIDLDHFKRINDGFGHAAGDEVLRRFAAVACSVLRDSDVVARWGGEEFLLLLTNTDATQSGQTLERMRRSLAAPATWQDRPELAVTFSAGLATWGSGEAPEPVIERADVASYRAKAAGRDRWCLAETELGHPAT